jgi:hypothetical protein
MFAEEFVKAYERHINESLRTNRGNADLPKVKLEPLDEEKYMAEMAAREQAENEASDEPDDQIEEPHDKAPGEVLDDIEHLDELDALVDFDDLEKQLEADDEDPDQAKA